MVNGVLDSTIKAIVTRLVPPTTRASAFAARAGIGIIGGMIGPGGAEFRLPVLIGIFGFVTLRRSSTTRQ